MSPIDDSRSSNENKETYKIAQDLISDMNEQNNTEENTSSGKRNESRLYSGLWGVLIVLLLRLVVGGVFAFSGFVKAIDPWGSVYKFGEYLSVFGFENFEWILLFLAVALATAEFMLGVFVLLGLYRRFAPAMLLVVMAVMIPLTGYLAITDKVVDCGCFGDAITLGNTATFVKNLLLLPAILYLCAFNHRVKNVYGFAVQWIVAFLTMAYAMAVAFAGYYYQPMLDFRPYPVGSRLVQPTTNVNEGDNFVFIYEKNGERASFSIDSLPDDSWTFVDRALKPGVKSSDTASEGLLLTTIAGEPVDSVIMASGEQLLFVFPDMAKVGISYTYLINEIYDYAQSHGVGVVGLTSATAEEVAGWNDLSMASYKLYNVDDSELKMLARGNPAVVYLKDGIVEWKRTLQSISMDLITSNSEIEDVASDFNSSKWLSWLTSTYAIAMILLLIVNRTHLLLKIRIKSNNKKKNKA